MFNMGGLPTTAKLSLELADSALKYADSSVDSNADPPKTDVWVQTFFGII